MPSLPPRTSCGPAMCCHSWRTTASSSCRRRRCRPSSAPSPAAISPTMCCRRCELGDAVRLELAKDASPELEPILAGAIKVGPNDVYRLASPLQLSDLTQLATGDPRPELRVEPLTPTLPPAIRDADSIFEVVAKRDVLLHHPYESFDPVV